MPDTILSPQRIATEAFTDAAAAVARLAEIYERNVGFLRDAFEAYIRGEPLKARVRAFYPFVRITTGTHARLDSRLSYGFVSGPGVYETSVILDSPRSRPRRARIPSRKSSRCVVMT